MSGFEPCPICGAELTVGALHYLDGTGAPIDELEDMADPADPMAPVSVESVTGARYDPIEWEHREGFMGDYRDMLDGVGYISLECRCGFCFFSDRGAFPRKGWLEAFRAKADRRRGA